MASLSDSRLACFAPRQREGFQSSEICSAHAGQRYPISDGFGKVLAYPKDEEAAGAAAEVVQAFAVPADEVGGIDGTEKCVPDYAFSQTSGRRRRSPTLHAPC